MNEVVLILVVVDDGLVQVLTQMILRIIEVLILVVVDDGLVLRCFTHKDILKDCLNPCCSGRWSSTSAWKISSCLECVLILVVVDDGLVQEAIAYKESLKRS